MQHSSLGFHTFAIDEMMSERVRNGILEDAKNYARNTNRIRVRPMKKEDGSIIPKSHIIEFKEKHKGLTWCVTYNPMAYSELLKKNPYRLKATINPKLLAGKVDYITAADEAILDDCKVAFNNEARLISRRLGSFEEYSLNRVDYCINFDLKELSLNCTPKQMFKLIKQSYVPTHYTEQLLDYDYKSHRRKKDKYSLYLVCDSVVINCYWKHKQLLREYPDCPNLDDALNVIRFEVQCKYPKVHSMTSIIDKVQGPYRGLLYDNVSTAVIEQYFSKVIRKGDYLTLEGARWMVEAYGFKQNKKDRLIWTLEFVNESRGIAKAKAKLEGKDLNNFNRSLKDLDDILINPVTIPRDWKIDHIPNLLRAYYDSIWEERFWINNEYRFNKLLFEYLSEKG